MEVDSEEDVSLDLDNSEEGEEEEDVDFVDNSNAEDDEDEKPEIDHIIPGSDEEDVKPDLETLKNRLKPDPADVRISKPGIIYLSTIPPGMNVKQVREYFTQFGELNRSFLQPEKLKWKSKSKPKNQKFTEGWIEFRKRRHARKVAESLNNTQVGGKKRKVYHDFIWNIKYLRGFQWVHLNERLAYERISKKQKMRTEISAAKREVNFFAKSVDLSKNLKRRGLLGATKEPDQELQSNFKPPTTINQIPESGNSNKSSGLSEDRKNLFRSFGKQTK